jgi:hypothetical protein
MIECRRMAQDSRDDAFALLRVFSPRMSTILTATGHMESPDAPRFYERHGFRSLEGERLACVL